MKKTLLCNFLLLVTVFPSLAQSKVWVFLTDKGDQNFDPYAFFDQKAIDRRIKHGIDLYDKSDYPVYQPYIESVTAKVDRVTASSRWFNAICAYATEEEVETLLQLPFVQDVKHVNRGEVFCAGKTNEDGAFEPTEDQLKFMEAQIERMQGSAFHKMGLTGKGVRVAIFDVGFKSYKTNPAFEHIRSANRIIKTYNFVTNKENVDGWDTHGTFVMSCVGGKIKGKNIGLAIDAEFLLARTETWTEFYSEEEHWMEAAEWADKNGADIINSSLGYTYHRYFREDMDGQTSLVSRAANMAASKGILVVNSAGNEGTANWKNIGAPADADSVLSIGGIHPKTGIHTSFSSFGPTWDKRLKPNVSAYGHVVGSGPKGISETQGTSFSSPLVAGFAACAMQSRPTYSSAKMHQELEQSGDLYPYFDYAHGYGVPQASYFLTGPRVNTTTFNLKRSAGKVTIEILDSTEREQTTEDRYTTWPDYVFYHIQNKKGYLSNYFVVNPELNGGEEVDWEYEDLEETESSSPLVIRTSAYPKPYTLRVYYKGQVQELEIK